MRNKGRIFRYVGMVTGTVHSFYVIATTIDVCFMLNSITSGLQHTCCADWCMERANASKKCTSHTYCSHCMFSIFAWQQCHFNNVFTHISMLSLNGRLLNIVPVVISSVIIRLSSVLVCTFTPNVAKNTHFFNTTFITPCLMWLFSSWF